MEHQTTEKAEIKNGIRAIRRHLLPFKKELTVLTFLGFVSAIANGFVPYITGRFLDALIGVSQHKTSTTVNSLPVWAFLLGIWTIVQLIANNTDWVMDRLRRKIGTKIHMQIQADGFIHLLRLPLAFHKNVHINGVLQKLSNAAWRISTILRTITDIAPQFLSVIIGITLAASINLQLAGILVIGVLLYIALLVKILLPIAAIDSAAHHAWSEGWDDAATTVHQIESVKQATAEEYEINQVRLNLLGRTYDLWHQIERTWSNVGFFQRTIVFATQLAVFILSVHFVSTGAITVGGLVALNGYALMFFGPFVALGYSWQVIQTGITTAAHAEEAIFREPEEVYVPQGTVSLEHISGNVVFQNVSFRYEADQPEVLTDINFKVNPGDVVAFVGESGVGKSTTISLISAYYFPTKGSVLVNGIDTRKLNLTNLRRQIAVVPQEIALFNDTIKANIRYGAFDVSDEDILRVAKKAHIDEFINTLPKGYETIVGERGIKLSVGQKQRVAIARAMLRNPAILILDEPTSALDARTEQIVTEALEKLMHGRTTFIIAHRLSTVRKADTILVFQTGQIVETGSHQELIHREGGIYRRLYEYQIGLH